MTDTSIDTDIPIPEPTTWRRAETLRLLVALAVAILIGLGLWLDAAVTDKAQQQPQQCKPFTIGKSAFGSCDPLGGAGYPGQENGAEH